MFNKKRNTNIRQGAASIYSVVVCTILFSVITVGFVTLTVNEMSRSSEFSLSESSKHAAEAGVEDVKIAVAKCFANPSIGACDDLFKAQDDCQKGTKSLYKILNNINDESMLPDNIDSGGILIDEQGDNTSESTTEAYTCVIVDPYKEDYLGTLSSENPIKIIPLEVHNTGLGEKKGDVKYVEISWYSNSNLAKQGTQFKNINSNGYPIFTNEISNPPVITASIYQQNDSDITRGTLWLVPSSKSSLPSHDGIYDKLSYIKQYSDQVNTISKEALKKFGESGNPATRIGLPVRCESVNAGADANNEYLCKVNIEIPDYTYSSNRGSFLLVLSLPYQNPLTDFKVRMLKTLVPTPSGSSPALQFDKVQISVDSTGRANDIYSRVEKRLEDTNTIIPIPEYAMTLSESNDNNDALRKDFFITNEDDCWYTDYGNATNSEINIRQCYQH